MSDSFESWYWGLVLVGNNIDPRDVSSFAAMIAANGDKGIFNEKI